MSLDNYKFIEMVAVQWNPDMAARFPNAEHDGCRQMLQIADDGTHEAFDPPRCVGYHCNRCGAPTNMYGYHDCPDRVAQ